MDKMGSESGFFRAFVGLPIFGIATSIFAIVFARSPWIHPRTVAAQKYLLATLIAGTGLAANLFAFHGRISELARMLVGALTNGK